MRLLLRCALVCLAGAAALASGMAAQILIRDASEPAAANAGVEACLARVRDFDEYPLLFLGEEFEGHQLVWCSHRRTSGTDYGIPPTDQFIFVYGDCTPTGVSERSCKPPIQVHV
jgi:hypothetical protein